MSYDMLLTFKRLWHFSFFPVGRCSPKLELHRSYNSFLHFVIIFIFFGFDGLHNIKHLFAEEEQWGREGMGDRGVLRVLSNNWRYGGQSSHFQFLSYYSPQLLFCFVFLIIEPQIPKFCLNWFATLFSLVYFLRIDRLPRAGWFHSHSAKGKERNMILARRLGLLLCHTKALPLYCGRNSLGRIPDFIPGLST